MVIEELSKKVNAPKHNIVRGETTFTLTYTSFLSTAIYFMVINMGINQTFSFNLPYKSPMEKTESYFVQILAI